MKKRLIYTAVSAFAGYFLGIRILGALCQIFETEIHPATALITACAAAFSGFAFFEKIDEHLALHAYGSKIFTLPLWLICVFLCFIGRYVILDFQISPYTGGLGIMSQAACAVGAGTLLACFTLHLVHGIRLVFVRRFAFTKKDAAAFALIFVILNTLVILFCKYNRTIACWDTAGFWQIARKLAQIIDEDGVIAFVREIYSSVFTEDYNYIIAVPMAILCALFGEGRAVYILGVTNLCLYPLYMFAYIIARKKTKYPIIVTILTIAAFPFLFFVSTQGYIDAGAIALASLILWMWYSAKDDSSPERAFLTGALIAAMMVLRRWTVFFAIAYIAAFIVDSIVYKKKPSPPIWLLASLAFGLLFLFQPYVTVKLMANYSDMYAAYDFGLKKDFFTFVHYIGLLQLIAVSFTAVAMLFTRRLRRDGIFMLILIFVCFGIFVKIQSHGEQHLMLYIPAFFYLTVTMYSQLEKLGKIPFVAVLAAVSAVPVYTAVTSDNSKVATEILTLEPCISCMPQQRADVDQILALDYWLDENVGDKGKRISVIASSLSFNREILYNAEASLNIRRSFSCDRDVYMPWLPQVDGRDEIPYTILETEYVLVADPIQTHLAPGNQKVVTVPAESFLNGTDIAQAFVKLDTQFSVGWDNSINVYIYEKARDITDSEKAEFLAKFE